jgi:UDP:flavonoid glycosyltransferase YjiC (YdhE family)
MFAADAEREGLGFTAIRPDADTADQKLMKRIMDPRFGSQAVVRELVMPRLREMYDDLSRAAAGADLLVSHMLTYAVPVLAEKRGLPWLSTVLQPLVFFSAHDPPVLPPAPWLASLRVLGPRFNALWLGAAKRAAYPWGEPVRALRRELGLPAGKDPLFEGQHSPLGVLALFSGRFGPPQPDWPAGVRVCGFPFYDRDFGGQGLEARLSAFLGAGEPPIAFTLGSSAVHVAGRFYALAAEAARLLGRRAVLLAGPGSRALSGLPLGVVAAPSAPYHDLFPRCAAIVHSGGIGTTAQALRSGRPQLIIPFAHDQFDNASRVERLGAGRSLRRSRLDAAVLAGTLKSLLADPAAASHAAAVAVSVRGEKGAATACDSIEAALRSS